MAILSEFQKLTKVITTPIPANNQMKVAFWVPAATRAPSPSTTAHRTANSPAVFSPFPTPRPIASFPRSAPLVGDLLGHCLGEGAVAGDLGHVLPGHHLDPRPAGRLPQGPFVGIQQLPPAPTGVGDASSAQAFQDGLGIPAGGRGQCALAQGRSDVLDQVTDRLPRGGFGVPDQPDRPTFDPPGCIPPWDLHTVGV